MSKDYPHYREILAEHSAIYGDFYALTMAQAAHTVGIHKDIVTMHGYIRQNPFQGSYLLTAGQNIFMDWLSENWKFDDIDCENLRNEVVPDEYGEMTRVFTDSFIQECATTELELTIDLMPEGEIAFPDEPIVRVHGRFDQAEMIEGALLNIHNSQSLFATLASRLVYLADGAPILEFGLRRSQDIGGLAPSRGAYIAGITGTSNNLAHKYYSIPRKGTFAHAWVMLHENEIQAFVNYAKAMPHSGIFLVDTYDTIEGVERVIKICKENNVELKGIRLDSGDLAHLSIEARKLLDKNGFTNAKITASDGLNEEAIQSLISQGAKIDMWGVGTDLVTSRSQPALGMVYKLGAVYNGNITQDMIDTMRMKINAGENPNTDDFVRDVMKLSENSAKSSLPGELDVIRYLKKDENGNILRFDGDTIVSNFSPDFITSEQINRDVVSIPKNDFSQAKIFEKGTHAYNPLVRGFNRGRRVLPKETIHASRIRTAANLAFLDGSHRRLHNPHIYRVGLEQGLHTKREAMIKKIKGLTI